MREGDHFTHQRSLARHRPSARSDGRQPGVPPGQDCRAVRQYRVMSSTSAGSAWARKARHRCVEEGLYIPIVRCFEAQGGRTRRSSISFLAPGSRGLPVELEGDVYSLCACNDAGARQLVRLMDEFAMESLVLRSSGRIHFRGEQPCAQHHRDRKTAEGHLAFADPLRRLREAPVTLGGGDDDSERTLIEVDFPRRRRGLSSRGINVRGLLPRLCRCFGVQGRSRAGDTEQLGEPDAFPVRYPERGAF